MVEIYKIHKSKNQLKITLPRNIAAALGYKEGSKVRWVIDRDDLILKKAE